MPVELVLGLADAPTPFASPLMPGGFLTAGVGFGHVVFATTAFDESHRFLVDGLGLAQSDWLEMEIAAGHRAGGALLPLQRAPPHAGPGAGAVRAAAAAAPRDVRDERPRRRRRRVRPGVGDRPGDHERARPPRQRRHVQLLRGQPGRLPGRGRPRRPRDHRRRGTTTAATTGSAPGATSRCRSA